MKHATLKDVFEEHLKNISYDKQLYLNLQKYRLGWAQKGDIYIDFLGGNLTGVHPIRFSSADDDKFFTEILKADQPSLKYDLHKVPGIDKNHVIASNPVYLSLFWLMHEFAIDKNKAPYKPDDIIEAYYILAYKVISSLVTHYFIYNVDIPTAKAVYERLSNRYLIKRFGTWQKVFDHRAKDVIEGGLHYDRVLSGSAEDATRVIADLQSRIREIVKNIYAILIDVKNKNEKVHSSSVLEDDDEGGMGTKAIPGGPESYARYVRDIINRPNDFINDDLIYLTRHIMPNLPEEYFVTTLRYISENVRIEPGSKDDFIDLSMNSSIGYLRENGIIGDYNKQALEALIKMKGYWSSSSVKSKEIKHIKEYLFNVAQTATGIRTKWMLTTICIGVLLYVFLRAIYKNKR